jgi:mercuric ion binding protein
MKKIQLVLLLLIGFTGMTMAQAPAPGTSTKRIVVIKTPTVQCQECKDRIEKYMSHEEGIMKVDVDFKKKIATVTYMADRTNVENIKTLIANCGYDADDVTAEPDSYKRLPTCCKKPEDGGGHGKP